MTETSPASGLSVDKRLAWFSVFVLLIACGRAPVSLPSVAAPTVVSRTSGDICYTLTDAEVAAATRREPIAGGSGFDQGGLRTCNWTLWFDPVESVGLTLSRPAAFAEGRLGGEENLLVAGNAAYWSDSLDTLTVATPKGTLTVLVWSETVDNRTAAIQLATVAVTRL